MTARRAGIAAVGAVAATTLLVVVAWAAATGPSGVLRGDGPERATPSPTETSASASPGSSGSAGPLQEPPPDPSWWQRSLAFLVDVALLVLCLVLALRYLPGLVRSAVRRRAAHARHGPGAADDSGFSVVQPPEAVAHEVLSDASAQRDLLQEGSPRNAIVACWHRFEAQGAAAGVERRPWETSSEYAMRILDLVEAHQPAVSRLGELYREARFSEHDVTEEHRRSALEALDAIHRSIGVLG